MGFNVLDTLNSKSRQQAQTGQLSNWYANMTYEETKAGIRDGITKIKESLWRLGIISAKSKGQRSIKQTDTKTSGSLRIKNMDCTAAQPADG